MPTLQQLLAEEQRQQVMKILAQRADNKWKQESVVEEDKRIMSEKMKNVHQVIESHSGSEQKQKSPYQVEEESPIQAAKIQPRR